MTQNRSVVDTIPDVKLAASNCERVVLDAYAIALQYAHDENKAFDTAVRAWRQHNRQRSARRCGARSDFDHPQQKERCGSSGSKDPGRKNVNSSLQEKS